MGVATPNPPIKRYQSLYWITMSILHKMGEKYCGSSSYFDYRSVFMVFCDHQDTESESHEIEMSMSQPIFTQGNQKWQ